MEKLSNISKSKLLYVMLGISIVFFFAKGLKYLIIGSYIPIIFILSIISILYWSLMSNNKFHFKVLKFWAILIIVWAIVRLGIWLIFQIDVNLTESHIREQFGIFQHIISILMLIIGIGIIRQTNQKASR